MPGDAAQLSLSITNTGARDAEEVVQLYMRDPVASISRPKLELRGFKRVEVKSGETRTVIFEVTPEQAAIYDRDGNWKIEAGTLEFFVGASSVDLRQTVTINVEAGGTSRTPAASIATRVNVR